MNSKKLSILFAVGIVAIAVGIWLAGRGASSAISSTSALYPNLQSSLQNAISVRIYSAGDTLAVDLRRDGDSWSVAQRSGYPADATKVRKLLLSLADAKIKEEKTSNPDNYASLNVQDVSDANASGMRIEVEGVEPKVDLIVGKRGPGTNSRYVRRAGEAQSWLIEASISDDRTPGDWLDKALLDITADRIQSATLTTQGDKPYTAAKRSQTDENFAVDNLPKGKALYSESAANSFATALASLNLSDVRPASEIEGKPDDRATYRTFDGLILELDGWQQDDKRYVAVRAQFDAAAAERFKLVKTEAPQAGENGEPATSKADDSAAPANSATSDKVDAQAQAAALADKLKDWAFEIPQYKYDAIFKPLKDLLKD
jgi:hypothetical protein